MKTHVVVGGHGDPPVVLLPGLRGWTATYRDLAPALVEHTRVVLIDPKGFGLSTQPVVGGYALDDFAEHVLATLDAIGVQDFVIGGLSLGGDVALRVALRAPERTRGLILLDSTGDALSDILRGLLRLTPGFLRVSFVRLFMQRRWSARHNLRTQFFRPERVSEALVNLYQTPAGVLGSEECAVRALATSPSPSVADRLGEITAPALLIWGVADPSFGHNARRFHRDLPESELHWIPDCGHVCVEEQPAVVTTLIAEWLQRQRAAPGEG